LTTQVIFQLDAYNDRAFGFELTAGSPELPARLAMLSILRDAFIHKLTIGIKYSVVESNKNGYALMIDIASQ